MGMIEELTTQVMKDQDPWAKVPNSQPPAAVEDHRWSCCPCARVFECFGKPIDFVMSSDFGQAGFR